MREQNVIIVEDKLQNHHTFTEDFRLGTQKDPSYQKIKVG
jgi:hypothetical protein